MKTEEIFISNSSIMDDVIRKHVYPFDVLPKIKEEILKLGATLGEDYILEKENVWIHKSAKVSPTAEIVGPAIIDEEAEIRHCAFIRGNAVIGKRCVLGNSCEIKNSILYDDVQAPHFNYIGDSILGYHSHTGAGSIVSNLKSDKSNVTILFDGKKVETNLRKVGAFLGDNVEVGCNCVLNPGTIIGPNSRVYPLTMVRGYIKRDCIVKSMDDIVCRENK